MKSYACGIMTAGVCALVLGALGCESPELSDASTTSSPTPAEPAPEPEQPTLFADAPPPIPEHENPATDVPRKFDKHDPIQGRRTTAVGGVAGNFGAALAAKHQGFIIAIDSANQLYWPQNDFSYPKSHEEFMTEVVALALNGEALPEIPADEEYIYVPEQGEVGLQIRLIPGSPKSKIPPAEPGKEHIFDPEILAAAGVTIPNPDAAELGPGGEPLSPDPRIRAQQLREREAAAAAGAGGEPAAADPLVDPRSRAEALGAERDSAIEEHGLAPGGLAPVGGLE
jgi:hypothetical protein